MTIQWFPGHMAKAMREIKEKKGQIDIVIEVIDARIPMASRNPKIDELLPTHPRLIVMTKSDLADPKITKEWVSFFNQKNQKAIALDVLNGFHSRKIESYCRDLISTEKKLIKGLIIGIPNVGKSTLINNLIGKKKAKTGYHPGVTKKQDWIQVGKSLRCCDTPGILWPKFEDQEIGILLAATHAIKDERFDITEIVYFIASYLLKHYPNYIKTRYKCETLPDTVDDLLDLIGKKRGCLVSGGEIDYDRLHSLFLHEFRRGLIGKISLERSV